MNKKTITDECWVNIFTAPYADTTDGAKYYISMSYESKKIALESIPPYMKERYIKTTNLINPVKQQSIEEVEKAMKTKTAIRQLIEKIEANLHAITETSSEADRARFGAYSRILMDAKELEPVNEQQIIDANNDGYDSGYDLRNNEYNAGQQYFSDNFEKP